MTPQQIQDLKKAITWMVEEGAGYVDDSQAAVCEAFNAAVVPQDHVQFELA